MGERIIHKKYIIFINNVSQAVIVGFRRSYVENVLVLLLSNAIKYSWPDQKAEIQLEFFFKRNFLTVTDNGKGSTLRVKRNICSVYIKLFQQTAAQKK